MVPRENHQNNFSKVKTTGGERSLKKQINYDKRGFTFKEKHFPKFYQLIDTKKAVHYTNMSRLYNHMNCFHE